MRRQQSGLAIEALRLDFPTVETRIKRFLKNYVDNCGSESVVLGFSGGLDSSTTAALAALSLGGKKGTWYRNAQRGDIYRD